MKLYEIYFSSISPSYLNTRSRNSNYYSNNEINVHEAKKSEIQSSTELSSLNSLISISNLPTG